MSAQPKKLDWGVIVATTWFLVALGLTVVLGPGLGLRGWAWLGLHHLLCAIGVSHELLRGWRRRHEEIAHV